MTDYEESIDSISMNGDNNSIIYDDITRQDLILQLKSKDKMILKLNSDIEDNKATISSLERQIADFVQRYGELKKNHDENYSSLQALLWVHCAQNHPDLSQIPPMEYESSQNSLIENDNRVGDHILGEILGEGTFAKVRSCRMVTRQDKDSNNKNYNLAIKIIDKSKIKTFTTLKRLSDEIGSLRRLSSSYIIGFHSVIHTTNYLYIITERGGKDMFEYLHMHPGVVNEDLAREIMLGILNGVNYIHEQGICHRDLKPENVLLTFLNSDMNSFEPGNVSVKLCDFGVCSKFRKKIMLLDFCGSPGFFAPEMITQGCYYGDKADIWSIGCILLELALGHRRFCLQWMKPYSYDVIQDAKLFSKKVNESIASLNDLLPVSNEYKDFVLDFLRIKASDRPQFKKISNHSWLKGMFHISSDGINADELSNLLNLYHNHSGDSNSLDNRKRLNSDSINLTPLGSVNQSFSASNSTLLTTTQKLAAYIQSASPKSRQTPQNGSGRQSGDGTPFIHQRFMDMPLSDDLNNQLNALKNSLEDSFRQNLGYNEESVHRGTYNDRRPTYNDRRPTYNERRPTYSMARGTITSIHDDEDAFNQSQLSDLRSQLLGLNQQSAPSTRLFPTLSHQPSFLQQIPEKSEDNLQKTGSISSNINYSNDDNSSSMDIDQSTNEEVDTAPFRLPPTVNWKNLLPQNSIKSQSIESLESIDSNANSNSIPVSSKTSNADYSRRRSFAPTHVIQKIVHVLLVEDSPFQRKLMARRLQSVGLVGEGSWEVVQCEDGESAIATVEACKDYKFDVIVVDQTLASDPSKLQGHEVVKHIRNKYPESIIIGCTANVSKHSSNLLLAGADLVWAKPLPREDVIFASIDSMMKMRRPQISGDVLNIRPAVVLSQQQQEQMDEDG